MFFFGTDFDFSLKCCAIVGLFMFQMCLESIWVWFESIYSPWREEEEETKAEESEYGWSGRITSKGLGNGDLELETRTSSRGYDSGGSEHTLTVDRNSDSGLSDLDLTAPLKYWRTKMLQVFQKMKTWEILWIFVGKLKACQVFQGTEARKRIVLEGCHVETELPWKRYPRKWLKLALLPPKLFLQLMKKRKVLRNRVKLLPTIRPIVGCLWLASYKL